MSSPKISHASVVSPWHHLCSPGSGFWSVFIANEIIPSDSLMWSHSAVGEVSSESPLSLASGLLPALGCELRGCRAGRALAPGLSCSSWYWMAPGVVIHLCSCRYFCIFPDSWWVLPSSPEEFWDVPSPPLPLPSVPIQLISKVQGTQFTHFSGLLVGRRGHTLRFGFQIAV